MIFICILCCFSSIHASFSSIDDVYFDLAWPGANENFPPIEDLPIDDSAFLITSADQEKFYCILPSEVKSGAEDTSSSYTGPQEYELLSSLFEQTACSYRIESYWTYELCHGRHLRQYHEDKELKQHKSKIQEYFLGKFDRFTLKKDYLRPIEAENDEKTTHNVQKQPIMRLENMDYPYFQLNFTEGTVYDLTNTPRRTFVRYICHEDGHGEMYEIKETSSCEYEVVVLTSLLCGHPNYQQKTHAVNKIKCHSLDGSPNKPKAFANFKEDYSRTTVFGRTGRGKVFHKKPGGIVDVVTRYQSAEKSGTTTSTTGSHTRQTTDPKDSSVKLEQREPITSNTQRVQSLPPADENLVREFLRGEYCITGGAGWWKHEFCFNKVVHQYHEAKNKPKIEVSLGIWDRDAHLQWLKENPAKRPKEGKSRRHISHYYTQGDICDITKKPRAVEVKLKCKENPSHPQSVSIYLVEPSTCEYILVVESPVMCPLVQHADNNALMDDYVAKQLEPVKEP